MTERDEDVSVHQSMGRCYLASLERVTFKSAKNSFAGLPCNAPSRAPNGKWWLTPNRVGRRVVYKVCNASAPLEQISHRCSGIRQNSGARRRNSGEFRYT